MTPQYYTMNHPGLIVCSFVENSIDQKRVNTGLKRVNTGLTFSLFFFRKKMPAKKKGPMKLEEMEEAHSNVNNLASADMVGLATDYGNPDVINAIPSAKEKDVLPDVKNKWQAASAKLVLPMKLQDKVSSFLATYDNCHLLSHLLMYDILW